MATKKQVKHPLVTKIKNNKQAAYKYFETEVELDDAEKLLKQCYGLGDWSSANVIRGYIKRYTGDDAETPEPKAKPKTKAKPKAKPKTKAKPKAKPKTESDDDVTGPAGYRRHVPDSRYNVNGGIGVIDYYADAAGFEYLPLKHVSSRARVKRGSTNMQRAKWLRKLWFAAIDFARDDDRASFFTQAIRHQICAKVSDENERKKLFKNIPMPKDA